MTVSVPRTPKRRTNAIGPTNVTQRSTAATTPGGARSATPTSQPTLCARTARLLAGQHRQLKSTTSSHLSTAARTIFRIFARCANPATPGKPLEMMIGGGKPLGCTPTERGKGDRISTARLLLSGRGQPRTKNPNQTGYWPLEESNRLRLTQLTWSYGLCSATYHSRF